MLRNLPSSDQAKPTFANLFFGGERDGCIAQREQP